MVSALFDEHSLSKNSCDLVDGWKVCHCEDDSMCNLRVTKFAVVLLALLLETVVIQKMAGVGNITGEPYHTDGCLTKTQL